MPTCHALHGCGVVKVCVWHVDLTPSASSLGMKPTPLWAKPALIPACGPSCFSVFLRGSTVGSHPHSLSRTFPAQHLRTSLPPSVPSCCPLLSPHLMVSAPRTEPLLGHLRDSSANNSRCPSLRQPCSWPPSSLCHTPPAMTTLDSYLFP